MSDASSIASRVVAKLDVEIRRRVARDPFAAAREDFHFDLVEITEPDARGNGGSCDGFSLLDAGVIYYRADVERPAVLYCRARTGAQVG